MGLSGLARMGVVPCADGQPCSSSSPLFKVRAGKGGGGGEFRDRTLYLTLGNSAQLPITLMCSPPHAPAPSTVRATVKFLSYRE